MTAPTINKINAAIAAHKVEVVKGKGYFYFADLAGTDSFKSHRIASVFSMNLRCMSLEDWIAHVNTALAN